MATLSLAAVFLAGCAPLDDGDGDGLGSDALSGSVALYSNIKLSGSQTMTVVYSASESATSVSAFYVEVESIAVDAATIGVEVTFGTDLPTGENQTVNLPTGSIPLGIYRVGLNLADAEGSLQVLSQGTFEITSLPAPVFTLPNQDMAVVPGTPVEIRASLGDPENAVQWRLFYIAAGSSTAGIPLDQLGMQIATGASNEVIETWSTTAIPVGTYQIGMSVTDSGQSIAQTAAAGAEGQISTVFNDHLVELTDQPPAARPPTVAVSQPSSDKLVLGTDTVLIQFGATVFEGPADLQSVKVFYDFDGLEGTYDERTVSDNLPVTATNVVFSGDLIDEGDNVHIGVTVDDGKNAPVTGYASGTITRVAPEDATLSVSQPSSPMARKPGEKVTVAWQVSGLPSGAEATVDVFMERIDATGEPVAGEDAIVILTPSPLTVTTALIDTTGLMGVYRVTVRIVFSDGSTAITTAAPASVTVSTLPKIVWLGNLTGTTPDLRGAIFGGALFEDNAGAALAGGEDYDDDELDDFIIVSRYGKPDATNPSGVGIGEAYLIRGSALYAGQEISLNTVSTAAVPGMVFTGIPIQNPTASTETHGIASAFISADADGDGLGEIWFGIPFANYMVQNTGQNLEREGMFAHGGVVCVSSKNSRVRGSGDTAGARILLGQVGMRFDVEAVLPEPRNADGSENADMQQLCSGDSIWLADLMKYFEGECDAGTPPPPAYQFVGCANRYWPQWEGGDQKQDTLIEPQHGFSPTLANNFIWSTWVRTGSSPCWGTALTNDNDCPSCDELNLASGGSCTTSCVPYEVLLDVKPDSSLESHVEVEPIDDAYCGMVDGVWEGSAPLLAEPPDCQDQKDGYASYMKNPYSILSVDNGQIVSLVSWYNDNKATGLVRGPAFTGFYVDEYVNGDDEIVLNQPYQPYGMRIIGRQRSTDHEEFSVFGTSITQVGPSIIISAPQRDAVEGFDADGFITSGELENAGMLYLFDNFAYWEMITDLEGSPTRMPPKPHMFLAGGGGVTGFIGSDHEIPPGTSASRWDLAVDRQYTLSSHPPTIVGGTGENIETVSGIGDFNGDVWEDFAVGSPSRGGNDGAVYIPFGRAPSLAGDFVLEKLALDTFDSQRLLGVLVTGDAGGAEEFGRVIAGGVDFNGDDIGDVVVGNPNGNGGTGEVVIIFSRSGVISPLGGVSIENLLANKQAARILGSPNDVGGEFGFNVANAGDVDGDGKDDLLVSAPSGTPRFDPDPYDSTLSLTEFGLDFDLDGEQDNVTGPLGVPDFNVDDTPVIDAADDLVHAGLVYLILSSADARTWSHASGNYEVDIDDLGSLELPGIVFVGRNGERTATSLATIDGDYLGGGNAADTAQGGSTFKVPIPAVGFDRGRGVGLGAVGDIDGDGLGDFLLGAMLADPRVNPQTGEGVRNGGEVYLIYGFKP